MLITFAHKRC